MLTFTQQEFRNAFAQLTPEAQEVIFSDELHGKILELATKNAIAPEHLENFVYIIECTLYGLIPQNDLLTSPPQSLHLLCLPLA